MKRVRQLNRNGCGVACVAMAAGVSYTAARIAIFGNDNPHDHRTTSMDLRRGLRALGVHCAERQLPMRVHHTHLSASAILKANVTRSGHWHWVIWDHHRQRILDPAKLTSRPRVVAYLRLL
jgi:ABC-type bacteriocin/lantibiotic exporter with double-glycine peptidase domain